MNSFLDNIIDRAVGEDASDIYIQSESPVFLRINGRMAAVSGPPEGYEMDEAIERILRVSGARAQLYDRRGRTCPTRDRWAAATERRPSGFASTCA